MRSPAARVACEVLLMCGHPGGAVHVTCEVLRSLGHSRVQRLSLVRFRCSVADKLPGMSLSKAVQWELPSRVHAFLLLRMNCPI